MIDWLPFAKQTLEGNTLLSVYHSFYSFISKISDSEALGTNKNKKWIGFILTYLDYPLMHH